MLILVLWLLKLAKFTSVIENFVNIVISKTYNTINSAILLGILVKMKTNVLTKIFFRTMQK